MPRGACLVWTVVVSVFTRQEAVAICSLKKKKWTLVFFSLKPLKKKKTQKSRLQTQCAHEAEIIQLAGRGCQKSVSLFNIINSRPRYRAQTNLSVALTHLFEVVLTCGHLCRRSLPIWSLTLTLTTLRPNSHSRSNHAISFPSRRVSGVIITVPPPGCRLFKFLGFFIQHFFSRISFDANNQQSVISFVERHHVQRAVEKRFAITYFPPRLSSPTPKNPIHEQRRDKKFRAVTNSSSSGFH